MRRDGIGDTLYLSIYLRCLPPPDEREEKGKARWEKTEEITGNGN
jgi:hypothetical protein